MNLLCGLFPNNTPPIKEEESKPKTSSVIVYVTSLEEWEDYYVKMYEFVSILRKNNPKANQLWQLLREDEAYTLHIIQEHNEYIIMDIENAKIKRRDVTITNVTTETDVVTYITTNTSP